MTDTQGAQTIERIDYRKEGVEMGVITPTFSEWFSRRLTLDDPQHTMDDVDFAKAKLNALGDYLDTYGPGATR